MTDVIEIAQYLEKNYYPKFKGGCPENLIPSTEALVKALDIHKDKVVVVMDKTKIKGVAVFLTLTDESYANLKNTDITDVETLGNLLQEKGSNLHFILLTADGLSTIMAGIRKAKKLKPRTVSWWSPDMKHLHRYNLN